MNKTLFSGALRRSLRLPCRLGTLARFTVPALLVSTSFGASVTWDPAQNLAGSDGSGVWSTGASNWANGTSDAGWVDGDSAIFGSGGTAGTVTVSSPLSVGDITFNPVTGSYSVTGSILNLGATSTITANASATIASSLAGSSTAITKAGSGTLTVNGTTTGISSIAVTAGTLATGTSGANSFGNAATAITVSDGASIRVGSGSTIQNNITFNGGSGAAAYIGGATLAGQTTLASGDTKINASNVATISGKITGSGSLTVSGPNKVVVSGATNDYSGGTNIENGTLEVAGGGNLGSGNVAITTSLALNTSAGDITLGNAMSGTGGIVKSGPGTATLNGNVAATGNIVVGGGTLLINGTKSGTSTTAAVVGGGAILGGTGSIAGANPNTSSSINSNAAVSILAGGAISPGVTNSIGTLSVVGGLVWTSDNTTAGMLFNLSNTDNTSDRITITMGLNRLSGTSYIFDFQNSGVIGQTYTLITYGGTTSTSVSNLVATNLPAGTIGVFSLSGGSTANGNNAPTLIPGALTFTLVAVPEPAEYGVALAVLAGVAIFARRRNRSRRTIARETGNSVEKISMKKITRSLALLLLAALGFQSATAKTVTVNLETATFDDLQAAMNAGAITSVELATLYLNRRAVYDQAGIKINSVVSINPTLFDDAEAQDDLRSAGTLLGPLQGLVFCTKDSYPTINMVTSGGVKSWLSSVMGTFGSETGITYGPVVAPADCFVVAKLKAAGAVQLGHGNMDTWATSASSTTSNAYGTTLNAYMLGSSSGSSGGPGALTGSNFANFAWGGETGGSIRNPSDRAGITGFKVSVGTNSVNNIIPLVSDRDVVGPMARYAKDEAYIMDATATVIDPDDLWAPINYVPGRPLDSGYATKAASASLAGKRIGVVGTYLGVYRPTPLPTPIQLTDADVEKALGVGNGHGGIQNFGTTVTSNTTGLNTANPPVIPPTDAPVLAAHNRAVAELESLGATVVTVFLPPNLDTAVTIPTTFTDGTATPTAALSTNNPVVNSSNPVTGVTTGNPPGPVITATYANTTLAFENRSFQLFHGQGIYTRLTQANAASSSLSTTVRGLSYDNSASDFTVPAAVTHFQLKAIYNAIFEKFMDDNNLDALIWPISYTKSRTSNSVNGRDLVNNMGLPICTVPIGVYGSLGGEPITMGFLGRYRKEADILALAAAYQASYNYRIPSSLSPPLEGETITYTAAGDLFQKAPVTGTNIATPYSTRADKLAPVVSIKAKATTKDKKIILKGVATDASGIDSIRVYVNGHKVPAKLGKRWTAKVTASDIKKWTKSKAKTISVTVLAKDTYGNAAATIKSVKL